MKQGLAYISKRTNQFRHADKDGNVQWYNPISEYVAAMDIQRGRPLSIADADDLKGTDFAASAEACVVYTKSSKHESTIGLALNYAKAGEKVKVLSNGKFVYDLTKSTDKEYAPSFTYANDAGKIVYISPVAGELTTNRDLALFTYKHILQVGYIADAPNAKGETEVVIEVQPNGDTRGPIDNTQFEIELGEDIYISSEDPMRILAIGAESDSKFEFTFGTTNSIAKLDTRDFIAIQKQSGKTAFITFDESFDITNVDNIFSLEDKAFIKVSQFYDPANLKVFHVAKSTDVKIFLPAIEAALKSAYAYVSDDTLAEYEALSYTTRDVSGVTETISGLAHMIATTNGGYYNLYVSENAKASIFASTLVKNQGSSLNKGLAVLADMRNSKRQNVIGAYYGSVTDGLIKKGTKVLVIRQGEFTAGGDFFTKGETYYLGTNGRLTTGELEIYNSIVKIGTATGTSQIILDMTDSRMYNNGDLPVGYIKPSVENMAEFGFCIMDGATRYSTTDAAYSSLYTRLCGWFSSSELDVKTADGATTFVCPKMTAANGQYMQIKYLAEGIYKEIQRIPYLRFEGTFENLDTTTSIGLSKSDGLDITDLVLYGPDADKIEELELENLDIHLLVDVSKDENTTLWEEIPQGIDLYNNDIAYGYKWHVGRIAPTEEFTYGQYWLEAETYDGLGVCMPRNPVSPPELAKGRKYRVVVSRRENWNRQFDLNQILTNYVSQNFYDASGDPTTKSVSAKAVDDAIKLLVETKVLKVSEKAEFGTAKTPLLSGAIYAGRNADKVAFSLFGDYVSTSDTVILMLSDGKISEAWTGEGLTYAENEYIPRRILTEHENQTITSTNAVHGIKQGLGNGFDSDKIDGIKLGYRRSALVTSEEGYKPNTTTDFVPFVHNDEFSLMNKEAYYQVNSANTKTLQLISRTVGKYTLEDDTVLDYDAATNGVLKDSKAVSANWYVDTVSNSGNSYSTVYRLRSDSANPTATEGSVAGTDDWDIAFLKNTSLHTVNDNLAYVRANFVGTLITPSSVLYKNVKAEDFAQADYSKDYDKTDTSLFKDATTFGGNTYALGSALEAIHETPLSLFHYKSESSAFKDYLGIILERVAFVRDNTATINKKKLFDKTVVDSDNYTEYNYTDEELTSIKNYLNLLSDSREKGQSILSSVGMLLKAAKETQDRLLKLELSTFGADASDVPGNMKSKIDDSDGGVTSDPTFFGLNRLIQALCKEIFLTTNPTGSLSDGTYNPTDLSRIDTLDKEINGKAAENSNGVTRTALDSDKGKTFPDTVTVGEALPTDGFDGLNDAVNRIAEKVNALTQSIHGQDNINTNPERLDTLRANISTILSEIYADTKGTYADTVVASDGGIVNADFSDGGKKSRLDVLTEKLFNYTLGYKEGKQTYLTGTNARTVNGKAVSVSSVADGYTGNIPANIADYENYADTLDYLVETIGKEILPLYNDSTVRLGKNIATRLANLEQSLDVAALKLTKSGTFETIGTSDISSTLYSIVDFCNALCKWSGITYSKTENGAASYNALTKATSTLDTFYSTYGNISAKVEDINTRMISTEADNLTIWRNIGSWYKDLKDPVDATISDDMKALFKTVYGADKGKWSVTASNGVPGKATVTTDDENGRYTIASHRSGDSELFAGTDNILQNIVQELFKTPVHKEFNSDGTVESKIDYKEYLSYLKNGCYAVDARSSETEVTPISNGHLSTYFGTTDPVATALTAAGVTSGYNSKRSSRLDIIEDSIIAIRKLLGMNEFTTKAKYSGDVDYTKLNGDGETFYTTIGGVSFDPAVTGYKKGIFNLFYNNSSLAQFRNELGASTLQTAGTTVYSRIKALEDYATADKSDDSTLESQVESMNKDLFGSSTAGGKTTSYKSYIEADTVNGVGLSTIFGGTVATSWDAFKAIKASLDEKVLKTEYNAKMTALDKGISDLNSQLFTYAAGEGLSLSEAAGDVRTFSLDKAADTAYGGIRTGYSQTTGAKDYAVVLDRSGNAYVAVDWTDTTYSVAAKGGLSLNDTVFSLKEATSDAYGGIKLGFTKNTADRNYPVVLSSGMAYVNVDWTDTTYSAGNGLALSGTGNKFVNTGVMKVEGKTDRYTATFNTTTFTDDIFKEVEVPPTSIDDLGKISITNGKDTDTNDTAADVFVKGLGEAASYSAKQVGYIADLFAKARVNEYKSDILPLQIADNETSGLLGGLGMKAYATAKTLTSTMPIALLAIADDGLLYASADGTYRKAAIGTVTVGTTYTMGTYTFKTVILSGWANTLYQSIKMNFVRYFDKVNNAATALGVTITVAA